MDYDKRQQIVEDHQKLVDDQYAIGGSVAKQTDSNRESANQPYIANRTQSQTSDQIDNSKKRRGSKMMNELKLTESYIQKMKYGGIKDQSDSEEEDQRKTAMERDPTMTPMTTRAVATEERAKQVKKIGTFGTFMSLLKGFVCTAILYLPDSFRQAGWLFQIGALTFSCCLTIFCAYLLIETRKVVRLPSYSDMGERLYGRRGKIMVNIALFLSQAGFCCAYIRFIVVNFHQILTTLFQTEHDEIVTAGVCLVIFTLLCWVRKIEIFAQTHIFADIMILLTLLYVIIMGILQINDPVQREMIRKFDPVPPISKDGWATGFGFAIYSYEGIGIVLPVQDVTKNPETYFRIVAAVIAFVGFLYIGFGVYCTLIWRSSIEEIITSQVEKFAPEGLQYTIIILFCFNLLFSYPLVLYPAHLIVENTLYSTWPKSKKRQWTKNFSRFLLVLFTVIVTMLVADNIGKFLGILGAVTCTPIAFTFPAMFHLKIIAKTKCQIWTDWIIIVFSLVVMVFCGTMGIINW